MRYTLSENVDKSDELRKQMEHYRNCLQFLGSNVPIQVLCLPKSLENLLLRSGCLRVYDMINLDLAKIKGLGGKSLSLLRSRLDEFFSIRSRNSHSERCNIL